MKFSNASSSREATSMRHALYESPSSIGDCRVLSAMQEVQTSSKKEQPPQTELKHDLHLEVSLYWVCFIILTIIPLEHQRRTNGLLIRRFKTFCLAGFALLIFKMTSIFTKVSS